MKIIILALATLFALTGLLLAGNFAGLIGAKNYQALGGYLQDQTPQNLLDDTGNGLTAR